MRISDWSSDVCSSDLEHRVRPDALGRLHRHQPVAAAAAEHQPDLERVGYNHDRARLVEQLVRDRRLRDRLDVGQHAHRVGRTGVLLGSGMRGGGGAHGQQHRSEEHTSELQSLMRISYAVFCLKKKTTQITYIELNEL